MHTKYIIVIIVIIILIILKWLPRLRETINVSYINSFSKSYSLLPQTALGQVMLYVDGMNGIIHHNETIQWLYSLTASKVCDETYSWWCCLSLFLIINESSLISHVFFNIFMCLMLIKNIYHSMLW